MKRHRYTGSAIAATRFFKFKVPAYLWDAFTAACSGVLDGGESYQDVLRRYIASFNRGQFRDLKTVSHEGLQLTEGKVALNRRSAGSFVACCRFESQHCDEILAAFMVDFLAKID